MKNKNSLLLVLMLFVLQSSKASYWYPSSFERKTLEGYPVFSEQEKNIKITQPFLEQEGPEGKYYVISKNLEKAGFSPFVVKPEVKAVRHQRRQQQEGQIELFSPEGGPGYYNNLYRYQPLVNKYAAQFKGRARQGLAYSHQQAKQGISSWWQSLKDRFNHTKYNQ